jgi:hypothetical protein
LRSPLRLHCILAPLLQLAPSLLLLLVLPQTLLLLVLVLQLHWQAQRCR